MMEMYSLGSSSRGNAFVIRTGSQIWLIDAGLSATAIGKGLEEKGVSLSYLSGIWITHEHGDHVRGLDLLMRRTNVPVYITRSCLAASSLTPPPDRTRIIHCGDELQTATARIRVGAKAHDAADPCFFTFSFQGKRASVLTDLGHGGHEVETAIREANALILESNHDEEMLQNGPYPSFLKRRIAGSQGHLSNHQAASLLLKNAGPGLEHILLAHLSERNNTPSKAVATIAEAFSFWKFADQPILTVAPPQGNSPTIRLSLDADARRKRCDSTGTFRDRSPLPDPPTPS